MNKIETVRRLSATEAGQRWSTVEEIRAFREEMRALPEALANRIAPLLLPWEEMKPLIGPLVQRMDVTATAAKSMESAARAMTQTAASISLEVRQARPPWYERMLELAVAAALGVLLATLGTFAWDVLLNKQETRQAASTYNLIWQNATPKERGLLQEIVNRSR